MYNFYDDHKDPISEIELDLKLIDETLDKKISAADMVAGCSCGSRLCVRPEMSR